MELSLTNEINLTWLAELILIIGSLWSICYALIFKRNSLLGSAIITLGWTILTMAIAYRWLRLGHGPFISMYEILLSNLWSLLLVWLGVYWINKTLRTVLLFLLPLFFLFMGWLLVSHPGEVFFPPTYQTLWLYVHVALGKLFFGSLMIATGLAIAFLLSPYIGEQMKQRLPASRIIIEYMNQFLLVALIFDSLMLMAGAIWAQDAWGRFWAWDPLETWALICWLSIGLLLHIRVAWKLPDLGYSWFVISIFVLAFATFFGVPFISIAPHQGVV